MNAQCVHYNGATIIDTIVNNFRVLSSPLLTSLILFFCGCTGFIFIISYCNFQLYSIVSLRCIHLHHENWFVQLVKVFFSSLLPWTWLFMSNSPDISREAEYAYPTGALLLLCMYKLGYFMLFVVCVCFPCQVFLRHCITFFWSPVESWFPWLILH